MKAFGIWLAIVVIVFGGYALITISLRDTSRVFVFVDASVQMRGTPWRDVPRELDRIDDRDNAEFALAHGQDFSDPVLDHGWQPELTLPPSVEPFGGCSFDGATQFPESADADERILITVAGNTCDTAALTDWEIIELD
jgi:hypothetical protein